MPYALNIFLAEGDSSVVLQAVSSIAGRYSSFLRILGLPETQLAEIKVECHDNPQECLQKGIICLLQENFNSNKHGSLTWRRLVVAVADSAGGGNHTLAKKIAAEHKGNFIARICNNIEAKACITWVPSTINYHSCCQKFQNYLTVWWTERGRV